METFKKQLHIDFTHIYMSILLFWFLVLSLCVVYVWVLCICVGYVYTSAHTGGGQRWSLCALLYHSLTFYSETRSLSVPRDFQCSLVNWQTPETLLSMPYTDYRWMCSHIWLFI